MPLDLHSFPGTVDWSGDNPGILLKDSSGNFSAMSLFFRVSWSPAGTGRLLLLYASPDTAVPPPSQPNLLVGDSPALADFLVTNFIAKLAVFRDAPAFGGLRFEYANHFATHGDPLGPQYSETIANEEHAVELAWRQLEDPVALRLTPELTGTGEHDMFSLLVPSRDASITVNGASLPGSLGTRVQAGFETTTAFLYFAETWIIPDND
ncbi:MAG: hypothetical protein OXB95_09890 [Rhodobacteraceae bacterium]|nr:hypothetical protein [Paracoccaceae bacterium]